jgi:hypothetical protein
LGANPQQQMSASLGPVHLLLLDHSAADQLVHGGFCKRGADSFAIAMTIAVVRCRAALKSGKCGYSKRFTNYPRQPISADSFGAVRVVGSP